MIREKSDQSEFSHIPVVPKAPEQLCQSADVCTGHTVPSPPDRAPHDVQVDLHVGLSHASGSDEIWGVDARIRKEVRAEGNHPSVS